MRNHALFPARGTRARSAAVAGVLFLPLLGAQTPGSLPATGAPKVVARVRFENPSGRAMKDAILRGNLPLPPIYSGGAGELPFALAYGGRRFPTQATILSTYPIPDPKSPVGRPEIVELTARVDVPPLPGLSLDVVEVEGPLPASPRRPTPGPEVARLLSLERPLVLRGSDVFGNEYEAAIPLDSPPVEFFREGPLVETRIHVATMRPLREGPKGKPALPALWRVRAYVTQFEGEDFFLLDLLLHNGPVREDVLGAFYFRELSLAVREPFRFEVWKKPFGPTGGESAEGGSARLALVPPLEGGKMHWVPDQACFTVRTVLFAPAAAVRAKWSLNERPVFVPTGGESLYSWSNPATARYDASKYPLPRVPEGEQESVRARLDAQVAALEPAVVSAGKGGGFHRGRLGWALPYDDPYGGVGGGGGLAYVYEHETVATGHRRSMDRILLLMDRVWERQHHTLFFEDGKPYTLARHPFLLGARIGPPGGEAPAGDDPCPDRNFLWRGYLDARPGLPFEAQVRAVREGNLRPDYEDRLREYDSYDGQHQARAFHMMAAYYLLGDAIARDHIVNTAMVDNAARWKSLPWLEEHAARHPGKGIPGGRADGWTDHVRAAAFNVSRDPGVRSEIAETVARFYAVLEKAQSPETGNFIRNGAYPKFFAGEADWDQAWESGCIMADGAKGCLEMFRGGPRDEVAKRIAAIFAKRGRLSIGAGWNAAARAPFYAFRIGPPGKPDELFVPPVGERSDNFYLGTPFAWYFELTGDRAFVDRALEAAGLPRDRFVREYFPNGMWTYMVWLLQREESPRAFPRRRG